MVPIGIWLAVIGYGVAYSGWVQLGGGRCDILSAFRGRCQAPSSKPAAGQTQAQQQTAARQQAADLLPTVPIPQGASLA